MPLPILSNTQGALAPVTNGVIKTRTKQNDVCYDNSRDLNELGVVNYSSISTNEYVADIFTHSLGRHKH
jgi:hypothetical protein